MKLSDQCCEAPCPDPHSFEHYYEEVSVFTIVLGALLVVGSAVSVIPQNIKFFQEKSTEGVSFQTFYLSMYNQWSGITNNVMAQFPKILACSENFGKCSTNLISQFQAVVVWILYFSCLTQYIFYRFKEIGFVRETQIKFLFYAIFIAFLFATIPSVFVDGIINGSCTSRFVTTKTVFTAISAICSCFQWIPQIITTVKARSPGAFSVIAMAIQCPGCFLTLVVLVMSGNDWTTWVPWVVSFLLECVLLYFLIYYSVLEKRKQKLGQKQNSETEDLILEQEAESDQKEV